MREYYNKINSLCEFAFELEGLKCWGVFVILTMTNRGRKSQCCVLAFTVYLLTSGKRVRNNLKGFSKGIFIYGMQEFSKFEAKHIHHIRSCASSGTWCIVLSDMMHSSSWLDFPPVLLLLLFINTVSPPYRSFCLYREWNWAKIHLVVEV